MNIMHVFFFSYKCKESLSTECANVEHSIAYLQHSEARGFRYISVTCLVVSLLGFCTSRGYSGGGGEGWKKKAARVFDLKKVHIQLIVLVVEA